MYFLPLFLFVLKFTFAKPIDFKKLYESSLHTRDFSLPEPIIQKINSYAFISDWNSYSKKFTYKKINPQLLQLTSDQWIQNEFFSLHWSYQNEPMKQNEVAAYKAFQVLYHLQKMKNYFDTLTQWLNIKPLTHIKPVTKIRLSANHPFSPYEYFNPSETEHNTAKTIPKSQDSEIKAYLKNGGSPWNQEIWFAPMFAVPILSHYFPAPVLDTALCPDVVYHEYTHLISGQFLGENRIARTLSEGISDYFAASFISYPQLYTNKTCQFKKWQFMHKSFDVRSMATYNSGMDDGLVQLHFVPGMLWHIRQILSPALADLVILKALTKSTPSDLIFPQFTENVLLSLKELVPSDLAQTMINRIQVEVYQPRGITTQHAQTKLITKNIPKIKKILNTTYLEVFDHDLFQVTNETCRKWSFELDTSESSTFEPLIYARLNCDQQFFLFSFDFTQETPSFYENSSLTGTMKFHSQHLTKEKFPQLKNIIQYLNEHYSEKGHKTTLFSDSQILQIQHSRGFIHLL